MRIVTFYGCSRSIVNKNLYIMKSKEFKLAIKSIPNFNNLEFRLLFEELMSVKKRIYVSSFLETYKEDLKCAHCKSRKFIRWGRRNDLQRYKCKDCDKTFNSLSDTPLARLRKKGRWLNYAQCLKEGLSVRKAAKKCGIHKNTSFRWRHRFIANSQFVKPKELLGVVEVDDLVLNKSFKGYKPRDFEDKLRIRKLSRQKVFIVLGKDRNKNLTDSIIYRFNDKNVSDSIISDISGDSLFCSYSKEIYHKISKIKSLRHGFLLKEKNEKVKKDIVHLKNVIDYKERFYKWIISHFRGVATKYLNNYLGWYRQLNEFDDGINNFTILERAKTVGVYKYQPLKMTFK